MKLAHDLARACLPDFRSKFSRQDFTLAQLFACLVLREHMKLTYRRLVGMLKDCDWCLRLGMSRVPSTATLCRAFEHLMDPRNLNHALELLIERANRMGMTGDTLAIDSTMYDTHHFTRHYERRRSQHAGGDENLIKQRKSETMRKMPKLAIAGDTRSHLVTGTVTHTGQRSDAPDFHDLMIDAWCRCRPVVVLADAGYDSAFNHYLARDRMGIKSWIKAKVGRPTDKPPRDRHRRHMQRKLKGSQAGKPYGQRAEAETTISMIKRNLGGHLRSRTEAGREMEMFFKVVVHNLMVVWDQRVVTEPVRNRFVAGCHIATRRALCARCLHSSMVIRTQRPSGRSVAPSACHAPSPGRGPAGG